MHSMAFQHNKRRWNLKKYAKRLLFKANFAVFWAQKEVVGATTWVQNTLHGDQTCLLIIWVGLNANEPVHGHPRHPNCPK